jgi:hypothetical protein
VDWTQQGLVVAEKGLLSETSGSVKGGEILCQLSDYKHLKEGHYAVDLFNKLS